MLPFWNKEYILLWHTLLLHSKTAMHHIVRPSPARELWNLINNFPSPMYHAPCGVSECDALTALTTAAWNICDICEQSCCDSDTCCARLVSLLTSWGWGGRGRLASQAPALTQRSTARRRRSPWQSSSRGSRGQTTACKRALGEFFVMLLRIERVYAIQTPLAFMCRALRELGNSHNHKIFYYIENIKF